MKGHTYLWRNEDDGKQATALLRKQHAAFVRLVKKIQTSPNTRSYADPIEYAAWHMEVCDKILAALRQRGKK